MTTVDIQKCYESTIGLLRESKKPVNEDIGDWLYRKLVDKKNEILPKGVGGTKLFNRQAKILNYIRDARYDDAVALAKKNDVVDTTLFDQNKVFGRRYWKIPFGIIGPAAAIDGYDTLQETVHILPSAIQSLFIDSGLGSGNTFNLNADESTKYRDFCSFLLTHDGKYAELSYPTAEARRNDDYLLTIFFQHLIDFGWKTKNIVETAPGLVRFLVSNGFVGALKFLEKRGLFTPSVTLIERYNVQKGSEVYNYLATSSVKELTLHEPDIVRDPNRGNAIVGGDLVENMKKLGYAIDNPTEQVVDLSTLILLCRQLELVVNRYIMNGEKFDKKETNLFKGGDIDKTLNDLRRSLDTWHNQYCIKDASGKWVLKPDFGTLTPEQQNFIKQQFSLETKQRFEALEGVVNRNLEQFGFPPIKIALNPTDFSKNPLAYSQQFSNMIKNARLLK